MAEINKVDLEQLLNCALCPNLCRCDCPVLQVTGREAVAPAGKARLAAQVQQDFMVWNSELLEAVSNCLGCRNCTVLCPFPDLNLCDELLYSRTGEKKAGFSLPSWEPYLNNLKRYGSPYGQKTADQAVKVAKEAEVVYYAGCTTLANNPGVLDAAQQLLKKAGVSYTLISEDCCGYPAETWGDLELAGQLAAENCRKIAESGAKVLVTGCPECWQTFSERYPYWGHELPVKIIDGSTYFLNLIKEGQLKPEFIELKKISYHDPCIWARTAEKISEPRELIHKIPGITIEEPVYNGKETHCCGGGRMFQLSFPVTAAAVAARRLNDFSPVATIATACPFCREGLLQEGRKVLDLVEILALSCCNEND
ncbi:MAG: (Fe-S)-binding protein [Bacillota bacterium]|nr:(Fe-S)-binding protein [Bacillota bacterium]